jgi:exopolysaccharide biosynthesis protein
MGIKTDNIRGAARRARACGRLGTAAALIALALALNITAAALGAGRIVYTNTRRLADNLIFTDTVSWNDDVGREESYSLNLTGAGEAYPIIMADDTVYGGMTISQMTQYAASQGLNVLAAVNTDFFSMQTGIPIGIAVEDGEYISSPGPVPFSTVSFDGAGSVRFSKNAAVTIALSNDGSELNPENIGKSVDVINFNKYRHAVGGLVLYSSAYSTVSTRTSSPGWFVRFKILEGRPTVSGSMTLVVEDKLESDAALAIGDDYLILTSDADAGLQHVYDSFAPGDLVTMTTRCNDENLINARWATGGGDILISGGAITDPASWSKELLAKNPRTALGVRSDGSVLAYVLDGRDPTHSEGLTLATLAEEMLRQGCVDAVNLDGGGSSAMSVRLTGTPESVIISKPSDGSERKCSTYLLFVTELTPDGVPRRLALSNNGVIVLPGSSFELGYAASDAGFAPVPAPRDITASSSGLGRVDGTTYTAGSEPGVDAIDLYSPSGGASGTGEVFIIKTPTSLTVRRDGTGGALTQLIVAPGETVRLSASSTYYRQDVTAQPGSYVYSVNEIIGTVDAEGVFTAADVAAGTGMITVSAGERTVEISVEILGFDDVSGHWAKEYIYALAVKNIVTGVTPKSFSPNSTMKRGDFVLMLYRAAGSPAVDGFIPADDENASVPVEAFTDVYIGDYYARAVVWAKNTGITQGAGDGLFAPQSVLTRQDAFTLVRRALDVLITSGAGTLPEGDLTLFTDAADIAEYAQGPAAALVGMGIIEGSDGALTPRGQLTRAQMAKILESVLTYSPAPEPTPEPTPEQELEQETVQGQDQK